MLIEVFVKRPVLTNLLFVLLLTAGFFSMRSLPMEAFPEMNFGTVMVTTVWPGATPEDVQSQVTIPIEQRVGEVEHILHMNSVSSQGLSQIRIKFEETLKDDDYKNLFTDVQNKIQEVRKLPKTAEKPVAILVTTQDWRPTLSIALSGGSDERVLKRTAEWLKEELSLIDGVERVKEAGTRNGELIISLDQTAMQQASIGLDEVLAAVQTNSKNISAGILRSNNGTGVLVRTKGEYSNTEELRNLIIRTGDGTSNLKLRDIGDVNFGFEQAVGYRKQWGELAIVLNVEKTKYVNTLKLVPTVRERVAKFQNKIDKNIRIGFFNDSSEDINRRLNVLQSNLSLGIVLVFIILWVFIGLKNAFLAIVGIPFSFLTGFTFMEWYGISINEVSIFSLVIVSGMVVDDAIVILENIVRHYEMGKSLQSAAIEGSKEVFYPVVASTMTTICAFLPMVIMTGEMGRVMIIIPITVTFVLIASFIEAFLMLPCHFMEATFLERKLSRGRSAIKRLSSFWQRLDNLLVILLKPSLDKPKKALILFTILLIGLAYLPFIFTDHRLRQELFPSDVTRLWINVEGSSNSTMESSFKQSTPVENYLKDFLGPMVKNITTIVGGGLDENYHYVRGANRSQITVDLVEIDERSKTSDQIVNELRNAFETLHFPGVKRLKVLKVKTGPPIGKPIAKRITGRDVGQLNQAHEEIFSALGSVKEIINLDTSLKEGQPRIDIIVKEEPAHRAGLSKESIGKQVALAVDGIPAGVVHWRGEEVDIRLQYKKNQMRLKEDLQNLILTGPAGYKVRLVNVAELQFKQSFLRLNRHNEKTSITVSADINEAFDCTVSEANFVVDSVIGPILSKYPGIQVSEGSGEMTQTNKSLQSLMEAFYIATFLMYIILATQFNSFTQPFLIMVAIPYAFLGVVCGMGVFDLPFTMLTYIAMVGLAGVVVNDTIVLIDFINKARQELSLKEAVLQAARKRLRAISLTTATTVLGLLPVVLGFMGTSVIWQPMAVAVCFGIVSATSLTLFLVPCLYLVLEQLKEALKNTKNNKDGLYKGI